MEENNKRRIKKIQIKEGVHKFKKIKKEQKIEGKEFVENNDIQIDKPEEMKKEEIKKIDCFKLVVIKKVPWYKKAIKSIGGLLKKLVFAR